MATIGTIAVDMVANTVKFDKNIKKSRSHVSLLTKTTNLLSSSMGKLGLSIGAVGFGALIKSSIDAGDRIHKLNIRIGASTEALSQYMHVAELSGVTFNSLAIGWQRQTRRIAEAANGTGEARKALDELGLSAEKLNQLKPEQQFEILAESLSGVKNQADKVRLAMKFWDSEGVALLQIADAGADAIRGMREEADRLGLTLTQNQAQAMADANDSITRMKNSMGGLANIIAVQAGPAIISLANALQLNLPKAAQGGAAAIAMLKKQFFNAAAGVYELIAASQELDAAILPGEDSILSKGFSLVGLDVSSQASLQGAKDNLAKAISLRELAGEEAGKLVELADAMTASFAVSGGKPFSQLADEETLSASLSTAITFYDAHVAAYQASADKRLAIEKSVNSGIYQMQLNTWSLAAGLLNQFSGKHKAFAKLALAIETGVAIAQAKINTSVAVTKALSVDPTGALAARVAYLGGVQVALIAATGLARGFLEGGGGGGSSGGSVGGGGGGVPGSTNTPQDFQPGTGQGHTTIIRYEIGGELVDELIVDGVIRAQQDDRLTAQTEKGFEKVIFS